MITTVLFSFVYYFFMKRSREKKVIAARQKMIRSTFAVYLNNYDDIEFNEKVRKVQDADRMQLNINNESDLAMFGLGYKRGNAASPSGGTNFFSEQRPRGSSKMSGSRINEALALASGMHYSDDDENQTQSLSDTHYMEEDGEIDENGLENFEYPKEEKKHKTPKSK